MGRFTTFAAANLLAATASARPSAYIKRQNETTTITDFTELAPSPELNWTPCFERFTCTNLEVPLDYGDLSAGTTNIAFIKLSGGSDVTQDILFNPGGPGSGGVETFISGFGDDIAKTFNGDYNIVTFDPRGVGNSGPSPLACFSSDEEEASWTAAPPSAPLAEHYASSKAFGEWCTQTNAETDAKYAGTAAVVQDMLHFTELQAAQNGQVAHEAKIWYYGLSYGTIVGQTLAAMYPDRVERVILDGNVYGVEHYTGLVPSDVEDSDKAFGFFYQYCFEAGPELCAFAGESKSAAEIELRFRTLLKSLEESPLIVADPKVAPTPAIFKRSDFMNWAFVRAYAPMAGFPAIAEVAAGLEQGNVTAFLAANGMATSEVAEAAAHGAPSGDQLQMITCIDANTRYNLSSLEAFEEVTDLLVRMSYIQGEGTAKGNILLCNGMNIQPPASQLFPGFDKEIETNVPVLFVGTTGDPITPLSSAFKMSEYFKDSVVITQDAPGHGFMQVKSSCTNSIVQAYLKDLTLPEAGTICETDVKPFFNEPPARMAKRSFRHY